MVRSIYEEFYDEKKFAIIPMDFATSEKEKGGDLPPRPEYAPQWHKPLFDKLKNVELVILIGMYTQKYYLGKAAKKTLTETVDNFQEYLPLPHPSPRNRFWLTKNPWFEVEVLLELSERVKTILNL